MEHKFHWKHEISYAIIYWSISFFCLFLGLILSLEKATFHWKSLFFFFLFFLLVMFSRQQFIRFSEQGIQISAGFFRKKRLEISQITQVIIGENYLQIEYSGKRFEGFFSPKVMEEITRLFIKQLPDKITIIQQKEEKGGE